MVNQRVEPVAIDSCGKPPGGPLERQYRFPLGASKVDVCVGETRIAPGVDAIHGAEERRCASVIERLVRAEKYIVAELQFVCSN